MIMKKTMQTMTMVALAVFTFFAANANNDRKAVSTRIAYNFNFVGNMENYPVFELKLHNTDNEEYNLEIKDVAQSVLFSETLKGLAVSRKYKLEVEHDELKNIRFILTNKRTNESQVYKVQNDRYVVDNIVVTPL